MAIVTIIALTVTAIVTIIVTVIARLAVAVVMRSVIPVIAVVAVIVTIVAVGTVVLVIPTFGTVILLGLIDPIILLRFFLPGFYLFLDRLRLDLCLNRLGLDRGLRFFLDLGCLLDLCGLGLDFSRRLCLDRRLYGLNGLFSLCGLLLGSFLRFLNRGLFLRGLLLLMSLVVTNAFITSSTSFFLVYFSRT